MADFYDEDLAWCHHAGFSDPGLPGAVIAVLLDVRENVAAARVIREIAVFRRIGAAWRRSAETHVLAVRPVGEVVDRLRGAGFEVATADAIGFVRMLPRRTVFICRKAAC